MVIGDVFYKKKKKKSTTEAEDAGDSDECDMTDNEEDAVGESSDSEIEDDQAEDDGVLPELSQPSAKQPPTLIDTLDPVVKKVRKLASIFR